NPDLRYLAARCAPTQEARDAAFIQGYRDAPQNPWLAFAAGYTFAERRDWPQAVEAFTRACSGPLQCELIGLDAARARRVASGKPVVELPGMDAERARQVNEAAAIDEAGNARVSAELRPYAELSRGRIRAALDASAAQKSEAARVMRLAAASEGADRALVDRALALPPGDLESQTIWVSWALAAREGRDTAALRGIAESLAGSEQAMRVQAYLEALRAADDPIAAQAKLGKVTPEMMGHSYAMGIVMLGSKAPAQWRRDARLLLFAFERPYFS
ncbi:MAG: hypothetical protein ACXWBL_16710, partial [Usitatibacter sp.]